MVYIRYKDDGPLGYCGQCCSITSPRDVLFKVRDRDQARILCKAIERDATRLNSRVDGMWSTIDEDCLNPVQSWPSILKEGVING